MADVKTSPRKGSEDRTRDRIDVAPRFTQADVIRLNNLFRGQDAAEVVASVIGAVFHNIGQILVAIVVTGTPAIVSYLPILLLSGIAAGLFTGFAAQFLVNRMDREY